MQLDLRAGGEELHCTGLHICQLDLLGIADYIVFAIGFATFVPILGAPISIYGVSRTIVTPSLYI